MNTKKRALGRGLSALLEDASSTYSIGTIFNIRLDMIEANPYQPRNNFEEQSLRELGESIMKVGLIQPITVCKSEDDKFKLISGERRYRAAKMMGLEELPAYIRGAESNIEMLQMALIENLERKDLNPIEIALSFQRFVDEFSLTQEELSDKVGKKRSTVANYLRLLKLPAEIQAALRDNLLSMGHARAIIVVENAAEQLKLSARIIEKGLSVREVEKIVKEINERKEKPAPNKDLHKKYNNIKKELSAKLGVRIDLKKDNKGFVNIVIKCNSDNDLKNIIEILNK
ncbi:MAG: ParB/RepB/Spo0J family partition protein [Bacteroidales bacterium]|nr:ParB/RepB/Spo0J family partition protein [Bacteroidales bacterium]